MLKLVLCTLRLGQVSSLCGIADSTFGEINILSWNYVKNTSLCKLS